MHHLGGYHAGYHITVESMVRSATDAAAGEPGRLDVAVNSAGYDGSTPAQVTTTTAPNSLRADARRNYDEIVAAGKSVFARDGTDVPLEEVGREAGVGRGTLYHHFPTRDQRFVAILKDRVDELDAWAKQLLDAPDAGEAPSQWLRRYDRSAVEYRAARPTQPATARAQR